ncbi:MAG: hypothetical protein K2X87_11455 [Gemmataceae bacterium]|nr:hypothetical protein [Gemmataceae bacterium]
MADPMMFKGRWQFINRIVETLASAKSKGYVFHGQKRVGKTSILIHLRERLNDADQFLCTNFSLSDTATRPAEQPTEAAETESLFAYRFLRALWEALRDFAGRYPGRPVPPFDHPSLDALRADPNPGMTLRERLDDFRWACTQTPGWESRQLVFTIDEFTYLYDAILENDANPARGVPPAYMKFWKGRIEQRLFSAVRVGQDTMPKFLLRFRNELISLMPERLTYLDPQSARELIEDPVRVPETGKSRYLGGAVDKIIELTGGNPYYIQIFCDKLVQEMKRVSQAETTEVEVNELARQLVHDGVQGLTVSAFDGLLAAGNFLQEQAQMAQNWAVLYAIAQNSRGGGSAVRNCPAETVYAAPAVAHLGEVAVAERLRDLEDRRVVERPPQQPDAYRIRVRLFRDWLLHNPPPDHAPGRADG